MKPIRRPMPTPLQHICLGVATDVGYAEDNGQLR